jgi:hypothetical protein
MCLKKVQGKGPQSRNYYEDVKEWVPPPLSLLDFKSNNYIKVVQFVVHIFNNPFFTLLPPLGFKLRSSNLCSIYSINAWNSFFEVAGFTT